MNEIPIPHPHLGTKGECFKMRYSLLYSEKISGEAPIADTSVKSAIYDLNVDRSVRYACKNTVAADYLLEVLSRPLRCVKDIRYRNAALNDMLKAPELLDGLFSVLKGYDSLKTETEEMNGGIFRYGAATSTADRLDCAYERVYINAHFLRNVIAYIREIGQLLSGFELSSEALIKLKDLSIGVSQDSGFRELEKDAEQFRNETPENYRFTLSLRLDRLLELDRAELISVEPKKKERFNPLSALRHRKKDEIPQYVDIGNAAADNTELALSEALDTLADCYEAIADSLYEPLYGLSEELKFYRAALDIETTLRTSGLPLCTPEVLEAEANTVDAVEVCDILLLSEGKNGESIVANDISVSENKHGVLVRGDNNCGKTSFLRSIGCAQLFAQSGLFVCAKSFRASLRYGIFSHFSSAEKELRDNDTAGRFEGEVQDVAAMLNKIRPYSLVLLNETFQTTAYSEGAEGMKLILDALPLAKTKYIFVTHMLSVFELFGGAEESIITLRTGEGDAKYKLLPFTPPTQS